MNYNRKRSRSINNSFYGKIRELPGISVDNFENAKSEKCRAYFLSHYHLDHVKGLHTKELLNTLEVTKARIYMSELSAAIVREKSKDGPLMQYVKVLKLGTTLIELTRNDERKLDELFINVTVIPAGHCFGSVMYLFRTDNITVLFTGDFRVNINDVPKYAHFHKDGEPIMIDALYVDTTFIDVKFENFPKRSTGVEYLINEIGKWLRSGDDNMVALKTWANYGYEFVFNEIYKKLGLKVYVDSKKWRFYSTLPHLIKGVTNDPNMMRIHLCYSRTHTCTCVSQSGNYNSLFVNLSAYSWDNFEEDTKPIKWISEKALKVCFATHCSSSELHYFINYFNPKKVVGFPNEYLKKSKLTVEGKKN